MARKSTLLSWGKFFVKLLNLYSNSALRLSGIILFTFCCFLLAYVISLHFMYFIWEISSGLESFLIHCVASGYFSVNIYYNLFACSFTDPGSPKNTLHPSEIFGAREIHVDGRSIDVEQLVFTIKRGYSYKFCRKCNCMRPPRAHHCRFELSQHSCNLIVF